MKLEQHVVGISITVLLHLGLGLAIVMQDDCGWLAEGEADTTSGKFKDARVIEAGLARKAVEKKRQPQKQKKKKLILIK